MILSDIIETLLSHFWGLLGHPCYFHPPQLLAIFFLFCSVILHILRPPTALNRNGVAYCRFVLLKQHHLSGLFENTTKVSKLKPGCHTNITPFINKSTGVKTCRATKPVHETCRVHSSRHETKWRGHAHLPHWHGAQAFFASSVTTDNNFEWGW
jgi:hypothetical protein